jgi:TatD DNase family protein
MNIIKRKPVNMSLPVNIHTHQVFPENAIQVLSDDYQLFGQNLLKSEIGQTFRSLAFHPMKWLPNDSIDTEEATKHLQLQDVIAIGESGLDKNSPAPIGLQVALFRVQMQLSEQLSLPVIIHCVGKWNELELLYKEKKAGSPAWIIHGFRKTKLMEKFLRLGAYLSFGHALLYDERLQQAVCEAPFDRIFLETDGADVDIVQLYEKLADLKSLSLAAVTDQLFQNYIQVFHHGKLA